MRESEFVRCSKCREIYEASHDDLATYQCPKCYKTKGKVKMFDSDSFKKLTEALRSEKDRVTQHSDKWGNQ